MNKNATRKIPKTDRDTRKVVQKRVSIFKGYKKLRNYLTDVNTHARTRVNL